jgi:outer membrane autotransporter protein
MDAWRSGDRVGFVEGALSYAVAEKHPAERVFNRIYKAPPAYAPSWHAWGSAFGATQALKGDASTGSANLGDRAVGGALGFDVLANPNLLLGVGVGGSTSRFDVRDRATSGTLDGVHIGGYAMQRWGTTYASALVSYARFNNSTSRSITGIGPSETATGSFTSDQLGGRLEIGNTWNYGRYNVTPFAAMQVAQLWQNGYAETSITGAGTPGMLGLSYQPITVTSVPTSLGAQIDSRIALGNGMMWSPYLRAAWVHEFNPARSINATFNTIPAASFVVDGARAASDTAKIDIGTRLVLNANAALFASFNGEFSVQGQTYAGTGGLRVNW